MIISRSNTASRHFERSETASSPSGFCEEKSLFAFLSLILFAFITTLALAAPTVDLPFGPWKRASNEPILSHRAQPGNLRALLILRPSSITARSSCSTARKMPPVRHGSATPKAPTGIHFTRRPEPVLSPKLTTKKTAASKTHASRNSVTLTTSPTPASTKKTPSSASPLQAT